MSAFMEALITAFGYGGVGFVGGAWRGGAFAYNTAVTNVNTTVVHNTYVNNTVVNNTTVNNTTVNNVSYNGGTGGTTAQPTAAERQAEQEKHIAATPSKPSTNKPLAAIAACLFRRTTASRLSLRPPNRASFMAPA